MNTAACKRRGITQYFLMVICGMMLHGTVTLQAAAPTCKDAARKKEFSNEDANERPYDYFYADIVNKTFPKTFEKVTLITAPFPAQKKADWNIMFDCYYAYIVNPEAEWEMSDLIDDIEWEKMPSPMDSDWITTINTINRDFWVRLKEYETEYHDGKLNKDNAKEKLTLINKDIKKLRNIEDDITKHLKKELGTQGPLPALGKAGILERDWIIVYALSITLQMALGNLEKALTKFTT